MKKGIVIALGLLVVGGGFFLLKPRADRTYGTVVTAQAEEQAEEAAPAAEPYYDVKHRWSEMPRVGTVTLTFIVREPTSGGKAQDVEVTVSADMPSKRGTYAARENMAQNPRGVFKQPIRFAEAGDWEIRLSIQKGDQVVEVRTIEVRVE